MQKLCKAFDVHALWFIRVFTKYPVLGTLIFSTEIQYSKPLKNPYSFSTTIISGWQYRFFKLLFLHVWWCIWNIFDHFVETHEYFCLKEGMAIFKPFYHSDRVLMTLVFPRNPVLGRKKPFKPNPYKPYCV